MPEVKAVVRDKEGRPVSLLLGSTLEDELAWQIRCAQLPAPVREHRFLQGRRFRFDFAYPERKIAVECQGAVWTQGRHTRGAGAEKDAEKLSLAALAGWRVLIVCKVHIRSGQALAWLTEALGAVHA